MSGKKEVEDTMLDLLKPCSEGLGVRDASFSKKRQLGVTLSMKLSKNNTMQRNFPRW